MAGGVRFRPRSPVRQARRSSRASAAITVAAGDRHPAGGPTPSGRQTLVVGSHHCPGSQARGCGPTPSGRQTLPLGSHHCPGSQGSGWGPTPSGKQALLNGSQYCPGSHAELTPGIGGFATDFMGCPSGGAGDIGTAEKGDGVGELPCTTCACEMGSGCRQRGQVSEWLAWESAHATTRPQNGQV